MEVHDHPIPYPLECLNKDTKIKVTKQCKNKFVVSVDFIDEVEVDVVPLDVCGVVFGIPYMYNRDVIFKRRENIYCLIKEGRYFIPNVHIGKSKIYLVSSNQVKKLIGSSRKFVFRFLRHD